MTKTYSVEEVVIKYGNGKQIILDADESAEILAIYASNRKAKQKTFNSVQVTDQPVKPNLFKRLDNFIYKIFTR